jgi:hypothetical protein
MSVLFRSSNAQLAAVVQGSQGTEGAPNAASDAVRVYGDHPIGWGAEFNRIDTDYANASVSTSAPTISLGKGTMKVGAYLTPSSTPGAASDPDYGRLLMGCGMMETKTAANITGTAQAGSTSSTLKLAAGASAVDNIYVGMPVQLTGGTGATGTPIRIITAYNGTSKVATVFPNWDVTPDNTTGYKIPKNSLYSPITTAQSYLTLWGYQHNSASGGLSRRRRIYDAMGTCVFTGKPRGIIQAAFDFQGRIAAVPDDVAKPSAPTPLGIDPQPLQGAACYLGAGTAASQKIKFTDWSLDLGNEVQCFDDPNDSFGYDSAEIVKRDTKVSLTLNAQDIATRNNFAVAQAMTNQPLWIMWGALGTTGVCVYNPGVRITNIGLDNAQGWQAEKVDFDCTGADTESYICVF